MSMNKDTGYHFNKQNRDFYTLNKSVLFLNKYVYFFNLINKKYPIICNEIFLSFSFIYSESIQWVLMKKHYDLWFIQNLKYENFQ